MSNELWIPKLNPVKFVRLNPPDVPKYRLKRMEDYRFQDVIRPWNNRIKYFQKWQTSDVTYLQFESNFDPIVVDLVDQYGIKRESVAALQVRANKYKPGFFVYQVAISWAAIPVGCYDFQITLPDRVLISEPISVAVKWKNTVLLEYSNTKFHGDVIFETGIKFQLRVEGDEGFINPGSNVSIYEDQKLNPSILSSKPFNSFPYSFGGTRGIPDWMIEKNFLIWTCNDVQTDGKSLSKVDDKWEYKTIERYQMRSMKADLREGINRGSYIVSPGIDPNKRLLVAYNIQPKVLFGDIGQDVSDTTIRITGTE